jgi:hypothetical protein
MNIYSQQLIQVGKKFYIDCFYPLDFKFQFKTFYLILRFQFDKILEKN